MKTKYNLGDKVKIVAPADPDPAMHPDKGASYVGLTGVIVASEPWCEDTMFSVKLSDGRQDGFFEEEMTLA